jgi:hypothetical protein
MPRGRYVPATDIKPATSVQRAVSPSPIYAERFPTVPVTMPVTGSYTPPVIASMPRTSSYTPPVTIASMPRTSSYTPPVIASMPVSAVIPASAVMREVSPAPARAFPLLAGSPVAPAIRQISGPALRQVSGPAPVLRDHSPAPAKVITINAAGRDVSPVPMRVPTSGIALEAKVVQARSASPRRPLVISATSGATTVAARPSTPTNREGQASGPLSPRIQYREELA